MNNPEALGGTDWQMSTAITGRRVLPALEQLPELIPGLGAAVLCTADGYNLCALGLDETQVGKMAALASSLFSIGDAVVREVEVREGDRPLDAVSLNNDGLLIVSVKIPHPGVRNLILMVAARDASLGIVLMGARNVAAQVEEIFRG